MAIRVAFQMDHVGSVDIAGDSTFRLILEAQDRGHQIYHYTPSDLYLEDGSVMARACPLEVKNQKPDHYALGPEIFLDLGGVDVVWLRQDPPFDMSYITTTHLLELLMPQTLVVNNPVWVRNCPEKLMVLNYPDLIPDTLIARDMDSIRRFRDKHGDMIVKPLFGNGGAGIFLIRADDTNLNSLCEMFLQNSREPIIVQEYLPAVVKGDKRVILVDGVPVGAINRIPPRGETRSNLHVGGTANPVGLTRRDQEICARIGPTLADKGLIFAGIDIIGDKLTEINITSPTGIVELEQFDGTNVAALIWDAIAERLS